MLDTYIFSYSLYVDDIYFEISCTTHFLKLFLDFRRTKDNANIRELFNFKLKLTFQQNFLCLKEQWKKGLICCVYTYMYINLFRSQI